MKTRQEKALEIRDLITKINERVADLEEDGYIIYFSSKHVAGLGIKSISGKIDKVKINKSTNL